MRSLAPPWLRVLWDRLRPRPDERRSATGRLIDRDLYSRQGLESRVFDLNADLVESVYALARQEGRPADELAGELLAAGLEQRQRDNALWQLWLSLTPREQQVTALICQGYTYRQVGLQLMISPETVKSHARNILRKFDMRRMDEVRQVLGEWDFSAWNKF
jgi:DNA-binding CsgD family transcriptional regulator